MCAALFGSAEAERFSDPREAASLEDRRQVKHQKRWYQIARNEHERKLGHGSRGDGSVEIGGKQRHQRANTHGHRKIQNA